MASDLATLLTMPHPPPSAHAALWVFEGVAGLLLSMLSGRGAESCADHSWGVVVQSGAISNLIASQHLDVIPAQLDFAAPASLRGGGADTTLYVRLMLTTLRVVSSAAGQCEDATPHVLALALPPLR